MSQISTDPSYGRFDGLFKHFARTERKSLAVKVLSLKVDILNLMQNINTIRQWNARNLTESVNAYDRVSGLEYYQRAIGTVLKLSEAIQADINEIISVLTDEEKIAHFDDIDRLNNVVRDINIEKTNIIDEILVYVRSLNI